MELKLNGANTNELKEVWLNMQQWTGILASQEKIQQTLKEFRNICPSFDIGKKLH